MSSSRASIWYQSQFVFHFIGKASQAPAQGAAAAAAGSLAPQAVMTNIAEALVATTGRTLETLSGLSPSAVDATLVTASANEVLPELSSLEPGLAALPSVEASEADARAAQRTGLAATLALVPSVNAQFTERFTNATGFQNAPAQASGGINFSWRLDLVGVGALRAQNANAELARINAERARRTAADQLHSDWHALKAALKKAQSAKSQVTAARRATQLSHERNVAGVATQLDVIQAERDLFAAEVAQVQANAELATARAQLALKDDRQRGQPAYQRWIHSVRRMDQGAWQ
jgi:outer membrane protein TolC